MKKKISGKGALRAEKGFTLFISNDGMNDIVKIIKSLEDLWALVKHEIKKKVFLELL